MSEIIYVTEFKNQFDAWQLLHATRQKEKAHNDAGASGRVIEVVEKTALDEANAEVERLMAILGEFNVTALEAREKREAEANALLEWILAEMKTCRKNWCGTKHNLGCECYVCRTIEKIEQHRKGK